MVLPKRRPFLAKEQPFDPKNLLPGSIGKALKGVQLKCIDPDNNEVPNGEPGELVASGTGSDARLLEASGGNVRSALRR